MTTLWIYDVGGSNTPKSKLNPREKRALEEARGTLSLALPRVARLWAFVDQPGATIVIDGKKVGTAPLAREVGLEPGRHHVKAVYQERSAEGEYMIGAGEMLTANLALHVLPARPRRRRARRQSRQGARMR